MTSKMAATDMEFAALIDLSARIGTDPALVQGPGGNTSLKRDGTMWIKASGTWLSQARERSIMVGVALGPLLGALDRNDPACESGAQFVVAEANSAGLRPSIETTMHAALPHAVVLHVHCVETIAWAVRSDAQAQLEQRLHGFDWCLVPYVRPGLPLTQLIRQRLRADTTVLILANHGLVVGGPTVAAAASTLSTVVARLRRLARIAPIADVDALEALAAGSGYRLPERMAVHSTATDAQSLAIAQKGSLYPDHVVFLGPGVFVLQADETLAQALHRARQEMRGDPALLLVPGKGALVRRSAPPAAEAIAGCLADVLMRLSPEEPICTLSSVDEAAIINWDAEQYRRALARGAG